MFSTAIICTDLSPSSDSVVACAGQLGLLGVREAFLVHVIDVQGATGVDTGSSAGLTFERQAEALEAQGITVHVDMQLGYPPYAIEEIARQHDAGMILVGSRGQGLFTTSFSGSVSSDLVRIATRPVLLASLPALGDASQSDQVCGRMLAHILFPTDFSPSSRIAERLLGGLAARGVRRMTLLHVVDTALGNAHELRCDEAAERFAVLEARLREKGVESVETEIRIGSPDELVAEAAGSGAYSLVVMAPDGDDASEPPLGSVTHLVVQQTRCPVLLVPPGCRL